MKNLTLFCILILSHFGWNQTYAEIQKIVASDRTETARFGQTVAIDGNIAVVGAYGAGNFNSGQVYMYEYIAGTWTETQILVNSDQENYDRFGWSVAIDGDYIVVGAIGEDDDLNGNNSMSKAGAAYIFKNIAGTWTEIQKIIASDRSSDDEFGYALDINDSTIVIGTPQDFEDENGLNPIHHAGSVYIFDLNTSGVWVESQKIVAGDRAPDLYYPNGYSGEDLSDQFGHSVGVWGDYMIVGALNHDYRPDLSSDWQCGSAYIFERSGGVWVQVQQIINSDNIFAYSDPSSVWERFGSDVAIDSNIIVCGSWSQDYTVLGTDYRKNAGAAYVFMRNTSGVWNETQKLVAGTRTTGDHFGWDVKIHDGFIISGVEHDDEDDNEINTLNEAGSAYIFQMDGTGTFNQIQKISASDRDSLDDFGYAVDITTNNIIVGAFQQDYNTIGTDSLQEAGAAYLYTACTPITFNQTLTVCSGQSITVGTSTYNTTGIYTDILVAQNGCDSTVTTDLTVGSQYLITQDISICDGESITVGTSIYTANGTYTDNLIAVNGGCDSIVTTNLTVNPTYNITQTIEICDGDVATVGTSSYTTSGTFTDNLLTILGCDSVVTTTVVVNPTFNNTQNITLCQNETITVGTNTYNSAGTYVDVLNTINGCDSTITTTITESSSTGFEISQNITICYGESYAIGNSNYSTPGDYTDTLDMVAGFCDSIVHTNLTVNLPIDLSVNVNVNEIESNQNNSFYQWVDCNNNFQNITNTVSNQQQIVVAQTGNYAVIINNNGCIDTSACVFVNFVGLFENPLNESITIYPNPTNGKTTIANGIAETYNLVILNQLGQTVFNQQNIASINTELNLTYLPKGIYVIQIIYSDFTIVKKLIIE